MAWEDAEGDVRISMTLVLVDLLRADSNRSLKDVLVNISHATYSMALERHRHENQNRKAYLANTAKKLAMLESNASTMSLVLPRSKPTLGRAPSVTFPAPREKRTVLARRVMHHIRWLRQMLADVRSSGRSDMDSFQVPELASSQPLDMDRLWRM
ncbi:hypothetical protein DFH09DRAFT_1187113 [Mycena vulgaris]|nr:hypothetical protein DFH09DRAFT_1187113 [Mycena vulgaris]